MTSPFVGGGVITQTTTVRLSRHLSGWEDAPLWHAVALADTVSTDPALVEPS